MPPTSPPWGPGAGGKGLTAALVVPVVQGGEPLLPGIPEQQEESLATTAQFLRKNSAEAVQPK